LQDIDYKRTCCKRESHSKRKENFLTSLREMKECRYYRSFGSRKGTQGERERKHSEADFSNKQKYAKVV